MQSKIVPEKRMSLRTYEGPPDLLNGIGAFVKPRAILLVSAPAVVLGLSANAVIAAMLLALWIAVPRRR